jgi:hypothetical protein
MSQFATARFIVLDIALERGFSLSFTSLIAIYNRFVANLNRQRILVELLL